MLTLEKILKAEFADADLSEITSLLQHNDLYFPIIEGLQIINQHLKTKTKEIEIFGYPQISHVAVCVLIRINEYVKNLDSQNSTEDKETIVYICGSIFRRCLQILVKMLPDKSRILFTKSLYISLQDTCRMYKYDFNEVLQILSIISAADEKQAIQNALVPLAVNPTNGLQIPGYLWLGAKSKEDSFYEYISQIGICNISETNKFKSLFHSPDINLSINFNNHSVPFTLQFFHHLNKSKLLTYYGCKGIYQVLQYHVFDFDRIFLRNNTPQRAIDAIKKHPTWKNNEVIILEQINKLKA